MNMVSCGLLVGGQERVAVIDDTVEDPPYSSHAPIP